MAQVLDDIKYQNMLKELGATIDKYTRIQEILCKVSPEYHKKRNEEIKKLNKDLKMAILEVIMNKWGEEKGYGPNIMQKKKDLLKKAIKWKEE